MLAQKAGPRAPFQVRAADIANLTEEQFKEFVKALIRCERNDSDFISGEAVFGDEMKAADEGADAITDYLYMSAPAGAQRTSNLIPAGQTVWQLKAEKKAPSFAQLKEEVTKPAVKRALTCGGHYVLVAQQPNTATAQVRIGTELKRAARSKKVAFVGQSVLESHARRFPSLARLVSALRGEADAFGAMKAGLEWSDELPHETEFQDSSGRAEQMREVVEWLKAPPRVPASNIRVLGAPGVGKTRLILEAMRGSNFLPAVLYASGRNSVPPAFLAQAAGNADWEGVLVIDECRDSELRELRDSYGHIFNRLRLITIGHLEDEKEGSYGPETTVIKVELLDSAATVRLLLAKYPAMPPDRASWVAQKTRGFVKLALLLADAIAAEADERLERLDEKRLVCGYLKDVLKSDQSLKLFKMMALFTRVGISGTVAVQFAHVARCLELSRVDADSARGEAEKRGLISRADPYCYVTPELLQDWLVTVLLRDSFDSAAQMLEEAPVELLAFAAPRLGRFVDEGVQRTQELVDRLVSSNPVFQKARSLQNEHVAHVLSRLARATPLGTAALVRRWVESEGLENGPAQERRGLVYLLIELLWHPALFRFAFEQLLALACAESEPSIANNATGVVDSVFLVHLGPTQVSYSERIEAARTCFERGSSQARRLLVNAASSGLEVHETGIVSPLGRDLEGSWKPSTDEERRDARRDALAFISGALRDADATVREAAESQITRGFRSLLWDGLYAEALSALRLVGLELPSVREALEHAIAWDAERMSPDALKAVKRVYQEIPNDLVAEVRFAAGGWDLLDDKRLEIGLRTTADPKELAIRVLDSSLKEQVVAILASEETRNPGELTYQLGRADSKRTLWSLFVQQRKSSKAAWAASIYLSGNLEQHPQEQPFLEELLTSGDEFLMEVGSRTLPGITPSHRLIDLVTRCLERRQVNPRWLAGIQLGGWSSRVDLEALASLLGALLGHSKEGVEVALDATHMALHGGVALPKSLLLEVAKKSLRATRRDLYRWTKVAKAALPDFAFEIGGLLLANARSDRWLSSMDEAGTAFKLCLKSAGGALAMEALTQSVREGKYDPRVVALMGPEVIETAGLDTVLRWTQENGSAAQVVLAKLVPTAPVPLVFSMFETFGSSGTFASVFSAKFNTGGFGGELSDHMAGRAQSLEAWAANKEFPQNFRTWASVLAANLRKRERLERERERKQAEIEKLDER